MHTDTNLGKLKVTRIIISEALEITGLEEYVILLNIINNENLNRFSSLTTGKVNGLMVCLETLKLIEYGIKEIVRESFEIEVEHFESCGEASGLGLILLSNHAIFKRSMRLSYGLFF